MVFGGWYADVNFNGDPVRVLTMPVGGVQLYAKWIRPNVNVTFDSAGGSPVDAQSVAWDGKAHRPADPVRAGYAFGGWYYVGSERRRRRASRSICRSKGISRSWRHGSRWKPL